MVAAQTTSGGGKAGLVVTAGVLTVLALIGGGLVGKLTVARLRGVAAPSQAAAEAAKPYPATVEVRELPAIVTNLAAPPGSRVRLQVAAVLAKAATPDAAAVVAQLSDDIVAFLKTLSLPELQGASGLQNLREDLNERAAVRTQGKVREIVIEGLVVE